MAHCEAAENTIDLAIGLPQEELLPLELVQKHAPLALAASKPGLLQYGDDPVSEPFITCLIVCRELNTLELPSRSG